MRQVNRFLTNLSQSSVVEYLGFQAVVLLSWRSGLGATVDKYIPTGVNQSGSEAPRVTSEIPTEASILSDGQVVLGYCKDEVTIEHDGYILRTDPIATNFWFMGFSMWIQHPRIIVWRGPVLVPPSIWGTGNDCKFIVWDKYRIALNFCLRLVRLFVEVVWITTRMRNLFRRCKLLSVTLVKYIW